ncbi:MAG: diguanylate cyclase [Sandaracinaceae bacterium]|nr:diguanylate cyclase [Sandaracinaceae bacterium]
MAALLNAPLRAGEVQAALILADSSPRPDLSTLDPVALGTVCELIAERLVARQNLENTGVRRSDPAWPDSLPPDTAELAAWPGDAAGHDAVTGLPDRRVLLRSTEAALEAASAHGRGVAVALLALDRFQRIDDWLGRAVGDELLRQVAERLLDTTSEDDLVGRGSGDEFIVVLTGLGRARSALALADRLLHAVREPFHVQGYELSLSATIGLSRFPEDTTDAATLHRYAGIALHRAKGRRQGRLERFSPELKEAVEQRGEVERRLRRAIGAGELVLHYQPKVALRERRTTGVEALIRWRRGDTMVSPAQFLPVAEESELIVPIGTWVLLESCRQMKRWRDRGLPLESVSVNVAALQFSRPDFVGTVARSLEAAKLEPRHLELEVTGDVAHGRRRRGRRAARRAPPAGRSRLGGRLRDGLLVARLPAAAPGRRAEDRSLLREGPRRRGRGARARPRARAGHHGARPQPRPARARRGRGDRGAARRARRARLRRRAGLPLLAAAPARSARGRRPLSCARVCSALYAAVRGASRRAASDARSRASRAAIARGTGVAEVRAHERSASHAHPREPPPHPPRPLHPRRAGRRLRRRRSHDRHLAAGGRHDPSSRRHALDADVTLEIDGAASTFDLHLDLEVSGLSDTFDAHATYVDTGSELELTFTGITVPEGSESSVFPARTGSRASSWPASAARWCASPHRRATATSSWATRWPSPSTTPSSTSPPAPTSDLTRVQ